MSFLRRLPVRGGGLVPVAAGLAVYGVANYAFLAFAGRTLTTSAFGPLSVEWTVLNAIGIGLFQPFEQELSRRTAAARALGQHSTSSVVRRALVVVAILLAVLTLGAAATWSLLADRLFGGDRAVVVLLVAAMAGIAASYVTRGLLSGNGRFERYGAQLAVDGAVRVVVSGVLAATGVREVAAYCAVLVVAPVLAVLATTPRWHALVLAGPAPLGSTASGLPTLIVASLLSQVLANAGPVLVQLEVGPGQEAAAGQFSAALVVARVPLFAFAAVQAVLLPGLASQVGARNPAGLRRRAGLVVGVTAGVGAAGVLLLWIAGAWIVPLLFGSRFEAGRTLVTVMAASGALFMVAQVAGQVLLALDREVVVVAGWAAGVVGLASTWVLPGSVDLRVATALCMGAAASLAVLGVGAALAVQRWSAGMARPEEVRC